MGSMSWHIALWLGLGTYILRFAGFLVGQWRTFSARTLLAIELIPIALLAGLIVTQAVGTGSQGMTDRLIGIAAASLAAYKGLSLLPIFLIGVSTTALIRMV